MKPHIISYVGWLLVSAAAAFYAYGMYEAIALSWSKIPGETPIAYPEVLSTTIGTMQALLLANLGMVLGISIANPNSGLAKSLMLNKNSEADQKTPLEVKEKIQLIVVVVYVIALMACLVTWIVNGFSNDPKDVVSIIAESGKMFIGVVLAYLTAVLSK